MVLRTTVTLAARRVPAITFRFGSNAGSAGAASDSSTGGGAVATSNKSAGRAPAIEDWQLPARYHRSVMSQEEMDYINRGGPA